ncbi:hypothetical protein BD626DRAFT_525801 [Schizophyllum amplum]|uniref:Uncharacterized protein n=1 Tax=Schizophyllum amplum TaxID=97359 RepID=A0A550BSJ5_9AGAR|nr:hypothetical protein BD626DRAFT_525801 [Auriculariopsis ampla]
MKSDIHRICAAWICSTVCLSVVSDMIREVFIYVSFSSLRYHWVYMGRARPDTRLYALSTPPSESACMPRIAASRLPRAVDDEGASPIRRSA